jgi:hypothetical protein
MKTILPSGNEFMGIGLVADIPDQFILGGIEDIVEGKGELDHTKTRSQMTTSFGHRGDDNLPDLCRESGQFRKREIPDVLWGPDPCQSWGIGLLHRVRQHNGFNTLLETSLVNPGLQ